MASFQQRLIGAVRLDAATYEDVEHDPGATLQAGLVVALASLTSSVSWYFSVLELEWVIRGTIQALAAWFIGALALWLVGTRVLPGRNTEADLGQLLRAVGFAQTPGLFGLLVFIPLLGLFVPFLVAIWTIAATFVAVRQALDYEETFRAIVVCFLAWIVSAAVYFVLGIGATSAFG